MQINTDLSPISHSLSLVTHCIRKSRNGNENENQYLGLFACLLFGYCPAGHLLKHDTYIALWLFLNVSPDWLWIGSTLLTCMPLGVAQLQVTEWSAIVIVVVAVTSGYYYYYYGILPPCDSQSR